MILNFTLDEKDYVTHQLYIASQSERIKKKRRRGRIYVPLTYCFFGFLFALEHNFFPVVGFVLFAILWYFLYPIWQRRHYFNHYKGFIKENYRHYQVKIATIELNNDYIFSKDPVSEGKVMASEFEKIVEIPHLILIRLKSPLSFIIPANRIENIDQVREKLKEMSTLLNVPYIFDEKWEWR